MLPGSAGATPPNDQQLAQQHSRLVHAQQNLSSQCKKHFSQSHQNNHNPSTAPPPSSSQMNNNTHQHSAALSHSLGHSISNSIPHNSSSNPAGNVSQQGGAVPFPQNNTVPQNDVINHAAISDAQSVMSISPYAGAAPIMTATGQLSAGHTVNANIPYQMRRDKSNMSLASDPHQHHYTSISPPPGVLPNQTMHGSKSCHEFGLLQQRMEQQNYLQMQQHAHAHHLGHGHHPQQHQQFVSPPPSQFVSPPQHRPHPGHHVNRVSPHLQQSGHSCGYQHQHMMQQQHQHTPPPQGMYGHGHNSSQNLMSQYGSQHSLDGMQPHPQHPPVVHQATMSNPDHHIYSASMTAAAPHQPHPHLYQVYSTGSETARSHGSGFSSEHY